MVTAGLLIFLVAGYIAGYRMCWLDIKRGHIDPPEVESPK